MAVLEFGCGFLFVFGVLWLVAAAARFSPAVSTVLLTLFRRPSAAAATAPADDGEAPAAWTVRCRATLRDAAGTARKLEEAQLTLSHPKLHVADFDGGKSPGVLRLDQCKVQLVKTRKKGGALRSRWDEDNYLEILPKREGDALFAPKEQQQQGGGSASGEQYTSVHVSFKYARDLERWWILLRQSTRAGKAHAAAADWRRVLRTWNKESDTVGAGAPERSANVLLNRLLFHWQSRQAFSQYIVKKVNAKLRELVLPGPLAGSVTMQELHLGPRLPTIYAVGEPSVLAGQDIAVEGNVRYDDGTAWLRLSVDLDVCPNGVQLGLIPRVDVVVRIKSISGRVRIEIGGASDYLWLCFVGDPQFSISVELTTPDLPLLHGKEIPEVTAALSNLVRAELRESFVYPRMEDVFLPLIDEDEIPDDTWVVKESQLRNGVVPPPIETPTSPPRTAKRQPQPAWEDTPPVAERTGLDDVAATVAEAAGSIIAQLHATAQGEELQPEMTLAERQAHERDRHLRAVQRSKEKKMKVSAASLFGGVGKPKSSERRDSASTPPEEGLPATSSGPSLD
eukprot:TRINITY_DN36454_c0_g1_i1.p1 TRINITY_DN36454_c0_g1~~TRINITY_DN36454_c0_g1_i1.p1  ORF type:complete len:566 (+),score=158.81 TRINITY_DN36454_c0_g1_i1:67-1764(+)